MSLPRTPTLLSVRRERCAALLALATWAAAQLAAPAAQAGRLELSAHLGAAASGALFDAAATASRPWQTPEGTIEAEELTAEVDEAVVGGVRAGWPLSRRVALQASASVTQLNITAQALSAATRNVTFHDYDQMTAVLFDLVLIARLTPDPSHPYLLAGGGYSLLRFENGDTLDQSKPGLTLGAGFRWSLDPGFALDFDVRDQLVWVDTQDEPNRAAVSSFEGADPLHLWQLTVGACLKL